MKMNIKGLLLIGISFMMLSGRPAVQANDILNQNRLILNVEDFGAVGDGKTDDGPALRKLFEHASALGSPATIMFRKDASYYLGKEEHAIGSMFLNRASHIIVEGNNAQLIIDPHRRAFEVYRSEDITIRNFRIDYSPLPYTQGRITKIDNENGYLEFRVDKGFPSPICEG